MIFATIPTINSSQSYYYRHFIHSYCPLIYVNFIIFPLLLKSYPKRISTACPNSISYRCYFQYLEWVIYHV